MINKRGNTMKVESYNAIMACLDIIEAELNKIATAVGHCSYAEFKEKA